MLSKIIDYHEKSFFRTHNLEVTGSSPVWSTLKIKHLQRFCRCFFFCLRTPCEHRVQSQTPHEHKEILRTHLWCSQDVLLSNICNTRKLLLNNDPMPSTCVTLAYQNTHFLHGSKVTLNGTVYYCQNHRHFLCRYEGIIFYEICHFLLPVS